MYALGGATDALLVRVLSDYGLFLWLDRLSWLIWGVLAGWLLMRLLTWRLRWLAMLALPALVLLIVPTVAAWQAREILGRDFSYFATWPYYVYLAIPVLGMTVGGLVAARRPAPRTGKITSPESADTP